MVHKEIFCISCVFGLFPPLLPNRNKTSCIQNYALKPAVADALFLAD